MSEEQKILQIKALCQLTISSAEMVKSQNKDDVMFEYEQERYAKSKLRALQTARTIVDEFYFSAALHPIIDLCVAAGDVRDAAQLLTKVSADVVREAILEDHPGLDTYLHRDIA